MVKAILEVQHQISDLEQLMAAQMLGDNMEEKRSLHLIQQPSRAPAALGDVQA